MVGSISSYETREESRRKGIENKLNVQSCFTVSDIPVMGVLQSEVIFSSY